MGDDPALARLGVRPGDVVEAAEPDYRYGTGQLRLRVTSVGDVRLVDGVPWIELCGEERDARGVWVGRVVLVRLAGLVRRPGRP